MEIYSKKTYYNGIGIRTCIGLTKQLADSKTCQLTACKVPAIGYIMKGKKILNYYCYSKTYRGFQTFTDEKVFRRFLSLYRIKL